jgi:hypothetical protein
VTVTTTVTVIFNTMDTGDVMVWMDASGNLRGLHASADMEALIAEMLEAKGTVRIMIDDPATPICLAERVLRGLAQRGVEKIRASGLYSLFQGRLFCTGGAPISMPDLALDRDRLGVLAAASGRGDEGTPLYGIYVDEIGEIAGLEQVRGPRKSKEN